MKRTIPHLRGAAAPVTRTTVFAGLIASAAGSAGPAMAAEWRVLTVNARPAEGTAMFSFGAEGAISGSTGCNRFSATGRLTSGWLVIEGPVATTQMACPGTLSEQESRILSLFEDGLAVTFDPFDETLKLTGRTVTLLLAPVSAVPDPKPEPEAPGEGATLTPPDGSADSTPEAPAEAPSDPVPPETPTVFNTAYVAVYGLSGRLNVRAEPTASAKIVGGVQEGALLANKGCEERSDRTWCHISHIGNGRPQGWVAAEYLQPASASLRARGELFDRIGTLNCTIAPDASDETCDYGVARDPDGTVAVLVYLPDASVLLFEFLNGALVGASGQDGSPTATLSGDAVVVEAGQARIEIPQTAISGW